MEIEIVEPPALRGERWNEKEVHPRRRGTFTSAMAQSG